VFGGCGSAAIAAKFLSKPGNISVGIGFLGVALLAWVLSSLAPSGSCSVVAAAP